MSISAVKIFFFPHAGGGATFYNKLKKELSNSFDICLVEYPGRGKLIHLPLNQHINELSEFLMNTLELRGKYAFFGHSMGALVAFHLTQLLSPKKENTPFWLGVSGHAPPDVPLKIDLTKMSDENLKKYMLKLGGIPSTLKHNEIFWEYVMPIFRSDLKIVKSCINSSEYQQNTTPISVPISVFNAKDDNIVSTNSISSWRKFSNKAIKFYQFQGGHFYFLNNETKLSKKIRQDVNLYLN